MYTPNYMAGLMDSWGLVFKSICHSINMEGSPERTDYRVVVEDVNGIMFVAEKIPRLLFDHKHKMARTLEFLSDNGLQGVTKYLLTSQNEYIKEYNGSFWQMIPFIEGNALKRPEYVNDAWRGKALAEFLINLRKTSKNIPYFDRLDPFSIKEYIYELVKPIKINRPDISKAISTVLNHLDEEFFFAHDSLSIAFCHGDYHPVNVIWGEHKINSVIDWEFLGYKPEIYDIANLIGCIGVEDPEALEGELVKSLLFEIKEADIISSYSWKYLPDMIIALRFAWLSEWLRKNDTEMQELEIVYMNLLISERDRLKAAWSIEGSFA